MEKRKNPEKELRNKSGLFFQTGLLITMMIVVSAFEYETVKHEITVDHLSGTEVDHFLPPITDIPPPPKPPRPVLAIPVPDPDPEPDIVPPEVTFDPTTIDVEPISGDGPDIEVAPVYHDYVEEMPTPVGGNEAFIKFISKHVRYPDKERRMHIEGKVFLQFIIDENGAITQVSTYKGASEGLDAEATRVLKMAPNWNPGRQGGRNVKVRMIIPINFTLN